MKSQIQKWGNSLAIRIPKLFADEAHLEQNSSVDVSLVKGKIVVVPCNPQSKYSLDKLLAGVTKKNIHREIESGTAVGDEAW